MVKARGGDEAYKDTSHKKKRGGLFDIIKIRFNTGGVDLPFVTLTIIVLTVGLVSLFSASYAYAYYHEGSSFHFILRQGIFALIGIVIMFIVSYLDYHVWHHLAVPIYLASIVMLVIVLLLPAQSGVHRWFSIAGISVQPSEIAKLAIILTFAHFSVLYRNKIKTFRYGVIPFAVLLIPIVILLVLEPHLSGTILVCAIAFVMMFVGGTSLKWFGIGGGILGAALVYIVLFTDLISYASTRLEVWKDPFVDPLGKGWQNIQSLYAIGSGGLMGLGLGNSRQKHLYISEPQNDFIFAVVCEEVGFIGATLIILLFALLIWRGFVVAMRAPDAFGMLISVGIIAQIGLQVALNIAVVTNTVPNTGISLPFFSYGGSALIMILFQMGIVMSVSRQSTVRRI